MELQRLAQNYCKIWLLRKSTMIGSRPRLKPVSSKRLLRSSKKMVTTLKIWRMLALRDWFKSILPKLLRFSTTISTKPKKERLTKTLILGNKKSPRKSKPRCLMHRKFSRWLKKIAAQTLLLTSKKTSEKSKQRMRKIKVMKHLNPKITRKLSSITPRA